MNFEINTCPLCQKPMSLCEDLLAFNYKIYSCPTEIEWIDITKKVKHSHYKVEVNSLFNIQRAYVMPWSIDNMDNTSRLYKFTKLKNNQFEKWVLVKELPLIKIDSEENLINRINKLMVFL